MAWMGRLEPAHMLAKLRFVKPVGNQPPQAALALGSVIVTVTMQRMTGIGRCSFSGDHENQPISPRTSFQKKTL
jgi:hypothetical protein